MEKILKVYICIYNWVTVLYHRDWHNSVNQLHFNQKIKHQTFYFILRFQVSQSLFDERKSKKSSMNRSIDIAISLFFEKS